MSTDDSDNARPLLLTIGHGSNSTDEFLRLLARHAVRTLLDVRSQPHSTRFPHFSKRTLEADLRLAGIGYRWMGDRLGGRPRDPALVDAEGNPVWDAITASASFQAGATEAAALAHGGTAALLCAEGDPDSCHRNRILAPEFEGRGFRVVHILPDGSLRPFQPSLGI